MTKKVLIFGCGPAGLMAAAAVRESGLEPVILSHKRKSEMFGAQYLHRPIPGFSPDQPFEVEYLLRGSPSQYRDKVYGPGFRGTVSPEDLSESHSGWDIRTTYNNLWEVFVDNITEYRITDGLSFQADLAAMTNEENVAHALSTVPLPLLCIAQDHGFTAQEIYAIGDAPERGVFAPFKPATINQVICDGRPETSWYRAANIQGYNTIEWPLKKKPPISNISGVTKPTSTNCTCHQPLLHRLGRYGKWQKGVLSHEAYYETLAGLSETSPV